MTFYRILSLDGGGIRGVLTATLLERMEEQHPGFLEQVDLFAGTSTGGIIALLLAGGRTPSQIREIYEERGEDIFRKTSFWNRLPFLPERFFKAEYSSEPLREIMREQVGDIRLGDLRRQVLIPTFDLDSQPTPAKPNQARSWKPKFYHNFPGSDSDNEEKVEDVVARTSAAPTFFPIYQRFIDGGVVANNPSMCALAQALHRDTGQQKLFNVTLLSLGTGFSPRFLTAHNAAWGLLKWAPHLVSVILGGIDEVAVYQCHQMLGDHYFRLCPRLPDNMELDDVSQIPLLKDIATGQNLDETLEWLRRYYSDPS